MQPPPYTWRDRSMIATLLPARPSAPARVLPPLPQPMTMTSMCSMMPPVAASFLIRPVLNLARSHGPASPLRWTLAHPPVTVAGSTPPPDENRCARARRPAPAARPLRHAVPLVDLATRLTCEPTWTTPGRAGTTRQGPSADGRHCTDLWTTAASVARGRRAVLILSHRRCHAPDEPRRSSRAAANCSRNSGSDWAR
jgi:hypothetical protein